VASHPAAASSRPTTIRPSPSAGPSNPPTTVSSSAAQGPGSFNVDLASIGIELSEEQKSWDPIKQKHEFGIRTGFGTSGKILLKPEVITNYVKIVKRPENVDVYELKIVHHTELDRKEWLVKDKTRKKAIFEQLKHQLGYQNLRNHQNYATDYELIWATDPLFPVDKDQQATPQATQTFPVNHPHTNIPITFESVSITWMKRIDASQSPLAMLRSSNASTNSPDDGAILIRGINAFMTQHARENMDAQHYASTAANRFFLTQGDHEKHLDGWQHLQQNLRAFRGFSISARPGVDDLYLNIHVGASPFLENVTVQQLLKHFRATGMVSPREAFNIFKGKEAVRSGSMPPVNVSIASIRSTVIRDGIHDNNTWPAFDYYLRTTLGLRDLQSSLDFSFDVDSSVPTGPISASKLELSGFPPFRGLLSQKQTSEMLDFACKLPFYNKKHLQEDGFSMLGISTVTGRQRAAAFGMEVGRSLLKVPARWLEPPTLRYSNNAPPAVFEEASWNLKNLEFFKSSKALKEILVLDLHQGPPNLAQLRSKLQSQLRRLGLINANVNNLTHGGQPVNASGVITEAWLGQYFRQLQQPISASIFVVLPKKCYDSYAHVKRVADLQLGRHAVCAVGSNIAKGGPVSDQYLANVAMKFNLKGGGSNHAVQVEHLASILPSVSQSKAKGCDTIIIGADVAHPTGSARPGCPSIAAVVGSTDDNYLHYPGSMRLQISRKETITELGDMVKERLIDWAKKHKQRLPANVLFYRDGVSESQYKSVREIEIPQLKTAYEKAHEYLGGFDPVPSFTLTFIVVGKRHNTRFFTDETCQENTFCSDLPKSDLPFREQMAEEEGQEFVMKNNKYSRVNHNILPGFVVDRVITHPYSNDFFLQSHRPLQGTGRSAHYFVLTNQMCLSSDELQRITHALCYIYARATKGVSYCSPAYYADRLCDRGRAWLREYLIGSRGVDRLKNEKDEVFKNRARDQIDNGNYWRPRANQNDQKYGQPRKNPWHPNLDDIMFYL